MTDSEKATVKINHAVAKLIVQPHVPNQARPVTHLISDRHYRDAVNQLNEAIALLHDARGHIQRIYT
jgi:hypothetical protein